MDIPDRGLGLHDMSTAPDYRHVWYNNSSGNIPVPEGVHHPAPDPASNGKHNRTASPAPPTKKKLKGSCRVDGCQRPLWENKRMCYPHCVYFGEDGQCKRCKITGCTKQAQGGRDGMCIRHWKEVYPDAQIQYSAKRCCEVEDCTKLAKGNCDGMCQKHFRASGAFSKKSRFCCKVEACAKQAVAGYDGMCVAHFRETNPDKVKLPVSKPCGVSGCDKQAQGGHHGMCKRHFREIHGDVTKRLCEVEGCKRMPQGGHDGMCVRHWKEANPNKPSRLNLKRCKVEGCTKLARSDGMCQKHWRMENPDAPNLHPRKVCKVDGCEKWPRSNCFGFCSKHFKETPTPPTEIEKSIEVSPVAPALDHCPQTAETDPVRGDDRLLVAGALDSLKNALGDDYDDDSGAEGGYTFGDLSDSELGAECDLLHSTREETLKKGSMSKCSSSTKETPMLCSKIQVRYDDLGMDIREMQQGRWPPAASGGKNLYLSKANDVTNDRIEDSVREKRNNICMVENYNCAVENCNRQSSCNGMCTAHWEESNPNPLIKSSSRRYCQIDGCAKLAKGHCYGMCQRHFREYSSIHFPGAHGRLSKLWCKIENCGKQALGGHDGMCVRHWRAENQGASAKYVSKPCRVEGCKSQSQGGHDGMCKRHWKEMNPETPVKRCCKVEGCNKHARTNGMCQKHFHKLTSLGSKPRRKSKAKGTVGETGADNGKKVKPSLSGTATVNVEQTFGFHSHPAAGALMAIADAVVGAGADNTGGKNGEVWLG